MFAAVFLGGPGLRLVREGTTAIADFLETDVPGGVTISSNTISTSSSNGPARIFADSVLGIFARGPSEVSLDDGAGVFACSEGGASSEPSSEGAGVLDR